MIKVNLKINFIKFLLFLYFCNTLIDAFVIKERDRHKNKSSKNDFAHYFDDEKHEHDLAYTKKSNLISKCTTCAEPLKCLPLIQCPMHMNLAEDKKPAICDLPAGEKGYCCKDQEEEEDGESEISLEHLKTIEVSLLEKARHKFQNILEKSDSSAQERTVEQHNLRENYLTGIEDVSILQFLSNEGEISAKDVLDKNFYRSFGRTCHRPNMCSSNGLRYRTVNGICNNPHHDRWFWGSADEPTQRLLPPAYEDGIWMPRLHATSGDILMSPREVSRIVLNDVDRPHPKHNLLLMQFGQLLGHDIVQSSTIRMQNGESIECCKSDGSAALPRQERHFACLPISISPQDEFYGRFGIGCMNFVRFALSTSSDCGTGYAKQVNRVTHFIDGSFIYGSNRDILNQLREFKGGRLLMFNEFGRELLPSTLDDEDCKNSNAVKNCFKSGDVRTNQIISLTALHVLFAREHNRIAHILTKVNPSWNDEELFEETRRIVIAELQHITYNEYLPSIIGERHMKTFRLKSAKHGYSHDYNDRLNPAITSEFSGAGFRMGHSSVDGKYNMQKGNERELINIADVMFNPERLKETAFYDNLMQTLWSQPMQMVDTSVTHGLTRFLFKNHNNVGLDLAALNIQRGRELGLQPYNEYLKLMGHKAIKSFKEFPSNIANNLMRVYKSTDDIDLWIGGLLEKPVEGGIVGPTFAEIIADQFARLKHGDRYFYENAAHINPGAFTLRQLNEIRKMTIARLICNNLDDRFSLRIPYSAFVRSDYPGNPTFHCDSNQLEQMDLNAWRV